MEKLMTNKYFITFLLIFAFSYNLSFSHGPSRQKVSETIEINANASEVWKVVSDFNNFKWNTDIKKISSNGNQVGSERIIEFNSSKKIKQKLEKIDVNKKMINWRVIETDNSILPVNSYAAKVFVKEKDGKTQVLYKSGFYRGFMGNDPPLELNDETSKRLVTEFILNNLKGLKNIIENN